jgi:hypothetical protein
VQLDDGKVHGATSLTWRKPPPEALGDKIMLSLTAFAEEIGAHPPGNGPF